MGRLWKYIYGKFEETREIAWSIVKSTWELQLSQIFRIKYVDHIERSSN